MAMFTSVWSLPSTIAGGLGFIVLGLLWMYWRFFTIKNNSGLPLPPGPKAEPFFGHFRIVPLVNPEFEYIRWGKEYSETSHNSPASFKLLIVRRL